MSAWYDKLIARRILGWNTEKWKDISINHIVPILKNLHGTVLEIGPGSGNLLQYLSYDVQYTCIEPNHYLHESIRAEAARCGFSKIEIVAGMAEKMPFAPDYFDAVISVRSLCSMDANVVLKEIKRVLKTGGKFVFVEHVAAPRGSVLRFVQKSIRYPHKLLRGGCDPAKDTEILIERAGFSNVKIERFKVNRDIVTSRIAGVATK